MRTVVLEQIVLVTQTSDSNYYGIQETRTGNHKGFIFRSEFDAGDFRFRTLIADKATRGNSWGLFSSIILKDLIRSLIVNGFNVYEFQTHSELFDWLSK